VALHRLRKVLGAPGWVVIEGDRYRLDPARHVDFDVERFETGVEAGLRALRSGDERDGERRLRAALALYRGAFLEHEPTRDWPVPRRDALRALHVDALTASGRRFLEDGDAEAAEETFERAVEEDDAREEAYRGLMVCRARSGDRAGALRLFDRLSGILRDQLQAEPHPETVGLADRLRRGLDV
jgi:DNA-binding SARP family transcriptional activator